MKIGGCIVLIRYSQYIGLQNFDLFKTYLKDLFCCVSFWLNLDYVSFSRPK